MTLELFSDNEIREEFIRRYTIPDGISINGFRSVADHLISFASGFIDEVEHFMVVFLTNKHTIIKTEVLSKGSISATTVFPREIIKKVLAYDANAVILAHNHPSGTLKPSNADISVTKKIKTALEAIDARLLDHIIITKTDYVSMTDDGHI